MERTLVVDHLKFGYEGLFSFEELYAAISSWFYEKGWDWWEKLNQEQITPSGKQIKLVLEPWKQITDYYKINMRLKINLTNIKEVDVEHNGQIVRLNQGLIRITFDAYVQSDVEGHWQGSPFKWFLLVLRDKYLQKEHYAKAERWIESDVEDLHQRIKTYLNTFRHNFGVGASEWT